MMPQSGQDATDTPQLPSEQQKSSTKKLDSAKSWGKKFIGYDAQVVEAASVADTLKRSFSGNVVKGTGSYLHSLFPFVDVSDLRNYSAFNCETNLSLSSVQWIGHYPWHKQWWAGDIIAGLTVGLVLSELPPKP